MVGVINAARLDQEVVSFQVVGEELYGGFGHVQEGRLVAFLALGQAVVVITQVAGGKQAQDFAVATPRDD